MPSRHFRSFSRGALVAVALATSGLGAAPARAGDDGAAPIWTGIGSVFGPYVGFEEKSPTIDYRERGKLVLPPKLALPPPAAPAAAGNANWPVDPDVKREAKAKVKDKTPNNDRFGRYSPALITPGSKVTMTINAGQGGGKPPPCPKDAKPGACSTNGQKDPTYGVATPNYNPLTWVGLQKKPPVVLGPEPNREWLTDPPVGLRAPAEGVGAKVDN